jgi:hypothetical protein
VTKPPHYRGRLADEPRPPPDDDHLWQRPIALLTLCVEGTQARDESAWIAAAVRVVLPNERPAARFVRLVLFHLLICAIAAIRYLPAGAEPGDSAARSSLISPDCEYDWASDAFLTDSRA